jgi:hypothetical protein
MNSERTNYETGLINCRFKNNGVKCQVLGEIHGLPYLAILYCTQGH